MPLGDFHLLKQKHVAGKAEAFLRDLIWSQSNFKSARTIVLVLMCFGANSGLCGFVFRKSWLSSNDPFLCNRSVPYTSILRALSHRFRDKNFFLLILFLLALLYSQGYSSVLWQIPTDLELLIPEQTAIDVRAFGRCQVGLRALCWAPSSTEKASCK